MAKIKEVFIHTNCTDAQASTIINDAIKMYTEEDGYEINYDIIVQDHINYEAQLLTVVIEVVENEEY